MDWAKLLKRVFDIDIQTGLKCGGQIKVISAIHNQQLIKRILTLLERIQRFPNWPLPEDHRKGMRVSLLFESHFLFPSLIGKAL